MSKTLYIIRGLPGSGKSTLARTLAPLNNFAADDFFTKGTVMCEKYNPDSDKMSGFADGYYAFDPAKLKAAHAACFNSVQNAIGRGEKTIAVANTFTQRWEYEEYLTLARMCGFTAVVLTCENNFGNIHGVPAHAIKRMRARWENHT